MGTWWWTQPVVWLLGGLVNARLTQQLLFARAEIALLRARVPGPIHVTPAEKAWLVRLGRPLGAALQGLITIVSYRTFARWLREQDNGGQPKASAVSTAPRAGRPATPEEIQELVLKLARANGTWGYSRILGELRKLGIQGVSRSTIRNILKAAGLLPAPKRGLGSWGAFIKRQLHTLWACDFFRVRVWTCRGIVEMYALFFIHLESRRVYLPNVTAQPNAAWVEQQARNFKMYCAEQSLPLGYLVRDLDTKYTQKFDEIIEADGAEVVPVGPAKPDMNAYAERFVLSIKSECLDKFNFFGEKQLRYVIKEWLVHYHEERPHQGIGNVPLNGESAEPVDVLSIEEVDCTERLGGLLKSYRRAA